MALILQDQTGATWALSVNSADDSLVIVPAPNNTPTPGSANSITVKAEDLISAALTEIAVLAAGEPVANDDNPWVLQKLQRVIDRWNARKPMIYNVNFYRFTLPVNTLPITIGPGADFDVIQRPQDIESISIILLTSANTEVEWELTKRDQAWWAAQTVKNQTSSLPTDFYYSPDWPNGGIYLWPTPTQTNDLRIQTRLILNQITTYSQNFTMPPAYWDLIVYELAISLCPSYTKEPSPTLVGLWKAALKAVQVNNISSPRGIVAQPGMPGVNLRGGFNYQNAQPSKG